MADFTLNLSGTVELDNSAVTEELKTEFIIEYTQGNVIDNYVEFDRQIGAKSIAFPRFSALSGSTTPLNEREDVTSEAMADSEIILTPAEYGNAVTTTRLAELQSGGRTGRAAVQLVAQDMARTMNKLGTAALEASTNVLYADGTADDNSLTAGDVMSGALLNKIYNKMARANVPFVTATGEYVAFLHDDVIHDLRAGASAGDWVDVVKYAQPGEALKNEVGMYRGFRIIRNNDCAFADQGGVGTVDAYKSSFLGKNGLGKAESQMPSLVITGPFDKLGRFVNIGWHGVLQYKIIEPTAVWQMVSASSVGNNAA